MKKALIREYVYAYAAVTPADGQLDWMLGSKMDTLTMNVFLRQVSQNCPEEFVVMVLDGAPSHRESARAGLRRSVPLQDCFLVPERSVDFEAARPTTG